MCSVNVKMITEDQISTKKRRKIIKKFKKRMEEKERALYVRLPHRIKDEQEVAKLFTGNFKVNLPRQSSRNCYVIFSTKEEQLKNLEAVKDAEINGKHVIVAPAKIEVQKKIVPMKKIVIPKVKPDLKVTRHLFVSNIKCGTTIDELKGVIPGCLSIKLLKPYTQNSRAAIVKMESPQVAAEYLTKLREAPIVAGRKLRINPDTRDRHKRDKPLKMYDKDGKETTKPQFEKKIVASNSTENDV